MGSRNRLFSDVDTALRRFAQSVADARYWGERAVTASEKAREDTRTAAARESADAIARAEAAHAEHMSRIEARLVALDADRAPAESPWNAQLWLDFSRPAEGLARLVRCGDLVASGKHGSLHLPALLPIIGGRHVLFKATGAGKERARAAMQGILLRLIASMPAGKVRLVCIDPVGLGATAAGFIKGLPDSLTGGQAWFASNDIKQRLAELEGHMAFVRQKYLGFGFTSMEDYNAKAGQIEEPYRILMVADFPSRFVESAAQRLVSIVTNGPGTGVYVIAMVDAGQKMPDGFDVADLERVSTVIEVKDTGAVWVDPDFRKCALTLDEAVQPREFERIVKVVRAAALSASDVRVTLDVAGLKETDWWTGDSRSRVRVPIGQFGAREIQFFEFDERLLSSGLVVGRAGSGKSTLLHTLIMGLACAYSPEELDLYLLDFKQVEFKDYASYALPHASVVAVKSEREFGLSVLRGLDKALQTRKDTFGAFTSLTEYRSKSCTVLPRIILVADEFQELFAYDDAVSRECGVILDRLVRTGRAFGINVLLASQTLAGANSVATATRNQIPIRVALQCSEEDSRIVLSDDNDRARLLERPGETIFNATNGRKEGNSRFQVFWLADDLREKHLRRLREMADRNEGLRARRPIVFDGESAAALEQNAVLVSVLEGADWPTLSRRSAVPAWLGDPIEMKGATAANFRRQSRSNLLVLSQNENEEDVAGMMSSALLALAAQHHPDRARFVVLNLADLDAPWHDLPASIAAEMPHDIRVVARRRAAQAIGEAAAEVIRRLDIEDDVELPRLYLFVLGLHRARELRRSDTAAWSTNGGIESGETALSPADSLAKILRDGPDVGVHTLLWCDTHATLSRMSSGGDPVEDFEMRVAFQMSADESRNLLDSETAAMLGHHRAVFYTDAGGARLEKFRPYAIPAPGFVTSMARKLRNRNAATTS
jgi:DNA segregation ATPase FtsK/SpoIIIE, S-DNA-T family